MIDERDQEKGHCRRLGHEVTFGYCRQEAGSSPCRLVLDCWWERFEVRDFLQQNLPAEAMARVERASAGPPPSKVLSLLELIQQAQQRTAGRKQP